MDPPAILRSIFIPSSEDCTNIVSYWTRNLRLLNLSVVNYDPYAATCMRDSALSTARRLPSTFFKPFPRLHFIEIRFTISLNILLLGRSDCLRISIKSAAGAIAVPVYQTSNMPGFLLITRIFTLDRALYRMEGLASIMNLV